jgi:hypothetical protein
VTQRLKNILSREGIRVEVLTTGVPPEAREAWYGRQVKGDAGLCGSPPVGGHWPGLCGIRGPHAKEPGFSRNQLD